MNHFIKVFFIILFVTIYLFASTVFFNSATIIKVNAQIFDALPLISQVVPKTIPLQGNNRIIIEGKNFTPDSVIIFNGEKVSDAKFINERQLEFFPPTQESPGLGTLSVITKNGVAQIELLIQSKSLEEIADGDITTILGGRSFIRDGETATSTSFASTTDIIQDQKGNFYVCDSGINRIRKINGTTGIITTIAGNGKRGFSGDGELALTASLSLESSGIVLDKQDNLFIADTKNMRVRKVDAKTGIISTIAGVGKKDQYDLHYNFEESDGKLATEVNIGFPNQLAMDNTGNLFIVNSEDHIILKIEAKTGIINRIVGNGRFGYDGDDKLATEAAIGVSDLVVDKIGNLFIADNFNRRVRKVDAVTKKISTIAGNPFGKSEDGILATEAQISVYSITLDKEESIFISQGFVKKIDANTGILTTIAGSISGKETDLDNEVAKDIYTRISIALVDDVGNVFVLEEGRIRKIDPTLGLITTLYGFKTNTSVIVDGASTNDKLNISDLTGIALDSLDNLYFATYSYIYYLDTKTGIIRKIAGTGKYNYDNPDGILAINASLFIKSIAVDKQDNLIIIDGFCIRKIDKTTNIITTLGGNNDFCYAYEFEDDVLATNTCLLFPNELVLDKQNNIYFIELGNDNHGYRNSVRRIDAKTKKISTIIANYKPLLSNDNSKEIYLHNPFGLSFDTQGNILVSEYEYFLGGRIYSINLSTEIISVIGGSSDASEEKSSSDGRPAIETRLNPISLIKDKKGNLFFVDTLPNKTDVLRRIDKKTKIVTTIAGNVKLGNGFSGDGAVATKAKFFYPGDLKIDSKGNLYFIDFGNDAIRVVKGVANKK